MSLNELVLKFEDLGKNLDNIINEVAVTVLFEAKRIMMIRVFDEHQNAEGQSLGKYSTKPSLIGAKSFRTKAAAETFFKQTKSAEKQAKAEGFESNWRTTTNNKHAYLLRGGYKELREIQGMPFGEITLQYSSDFKKNGIITVVNNDKTQLVFRTDEYAKIGRGFEQRKGMKVFYLQSDERKLLLELGQNKLNERINEHIN